VEADILGRFPVVRFLNDALVGGLTIGHHCIANRRPGCLGIYMAHGGDVEAQNKAGMDLLDFAERMAVDRADGDVATAACVRMLWTAVLAKDALHSGPGGSIRPATVPRQEAA